MAREVVAVTTNGDGKHIVMPTRDAGAVGYLLIILTVLVMCCVGTATTHYFYEYPPGLTPASPGSAVLIGLFRYKYVSCQLTNQDLCDGPITDFQCDPFTDYLKAASAFAIIADIFAGVTLIVLLVEVGTFAKVPWVVATILGFFTWICTLIVWAIILGGFNRTFCGAESLNDRRYEVGGGWGLFLISFCILPIGLILSVLRARRIPAPKPVVVATGPAVVPAPVVAPAGTTTVVATAPH